MKKKEKKRHFDCYKISRQVKHQIRLGQKPIVKLFPYFWQYFNRRKEQHPKTQFRFHQQQQQQIIIWKLILIFGLRYQICVKFESTLQHINALGVYTLKKAPNTSTSSDRRVLCIYFVIKMEISQPKNIYKDGLL